jgi:hypothetical protein
MSKSQARTTVPDPNAALAYKFWLARGFRDGSPEEDLFRAVCVNSMKLSMRSRIRKPDSDYDRQS